MTSKNYLVENNGTTSALISKDRVYRSLLIYKKTVTVDSNRQQAIILRSIRFRYAECNIAIWQTTPTSLTQIVFQCSNYVQQLHQAQSSLHSIFFIVGFKRSLHVHEILRYQLHLVFLYLQSCSQLNPIQCSIYGALKSSRSLPSFGLRSSI